MVIDRGRYKEQVDNSLEGDQRFHSRKQGEHKAGTMDNDSWVRYGGEDNTRSGNRYLGYQCRESVLMLVECALGRHYWKSNLMIARCNWVRYGREGNHRSGNRHLGYQCRESVLMFVEFALFQWEVRVTVTREPRQEQD